MLQPSLVMSEVIRAVPSYYTSNLKLWYSLPEPLAQLILLNLISRLIFITWPICSNLFGFIVLITPVFVPYITAFWSTFCIVMF